MYVNRKGSMIFTSMLDVTNAITDSNYNGYKRLLGFFGTHDRTSGSDIKSVIQFFTDKDMTLHKLDQTPTDQTMVLISFMYHVMNDQVVEFLTIGDSQNKHKYVIYPSANLPETLNAITIASMEVDVGSSGNVYLIETKPNQSTNGASVAQYTIRDDLTDVSLEPDKANVTNAYVTTMKVNIIDEIHENIQTKLDEITDSYKSRYISR